MHGARSLDLFPAQAVIPGDPPLAFREARIVLREGRLRVLAVTSAGPATVLDATVSDTVMADLRRPRRHQIYKFDVPAGTVYVTPSAGCGCGSPLRSMPV